MTKRKQQPPDDDAVIASADLWIERQRYVKQIAAELERQGEPAPVPTPLIRRELKRRHNITASHQQIWLDLFGTRNWFEITAKEK